MDGFSDANVLNAPLDEQADARMEVPLEKPLEKQLTMRENLVLGFIPAGHKQAVGKRDLARLAGLGERDVREIIYDLVVQRGVAIGSSTVSDTGGYFIIQDVDDLEVATRHLVPRARAIFRRARALERIAQRRFNRQLSLWPETVSGGRFP